jgi:phage repressor protein C with HTH and peptisase S24 domain
MGKESTFGTGERFRRIADELFDGNKSELARSLDMQPSSFAKYTDGNRRPGSKVLERLSRLGVNINWFLSGEGQMLDGTVAEHTDSSATFVLDRHPDADSDVVVLSEQSEERFFRIPIVRVRQDEQGDRTLEETEGVECLSESFIRDRYGVEPQHLREFRVSGNAMADTIRPGDRVIVEVGGCDSLVDGQVCLLGVSAGILIRRVTLQADSIVLAADNSNVPRQEVSREEWVEQYDPIARVLEVVRPL